MNSFLLRRIRRTPLFFAAAGALLVLAVGGNTAMFAVVNAVVLRPLPVTDEDRLVALHLTRAGTPRGPASAPLLDDVRHASTLAEAAAVFQWSANLADEIEAERLQGMRVSGNYFPLLGAGVALGRALTTDDSRPGSLAVVLLSDGLWKRRFGASPSAVGQTIRLNGETFTVAGVLRPDFPMQIRDVDVIAPWVQESDVRRTNPALGFLRIVARLAPGVTAAQAHDELDARLDAFRKTYPQAIAADQRVSIVPLRQDLVGRTAGMLNMLAAAMAVVMFVAVANLTNLFLVNGARREHEFVTRRALGASRGRLVRQVLTEALVVAVAGAVLGVLAAGLALQAVLASAGTTIPRSAEIAIDVVAAAFGVISALLITLLATLLPAFHLSADSGPATASQRGATFAGRRVRALFVCAQVALSVLLVVAAGLLVRSFAAVQHVQPGFQPGGVLTLRLSLPRSKYRATSDLARFTTDLTERVRALPGVAGVAAANVVPMNGYLATSTIGVPGVENHPVETWPEAHYRMISASYFSVMGIPVTGRTFTDADDASAMPVAVISRGLAARYWGDANPIGAQIRVRDNIDAFRTLVIVGIAGDVRHLGLEVDSPSELYVPIPQVPDATSVWLANNMYWAVKATGEPTVLATPVRRAVAAVDRDVAASFVRTMEEWLDRTVQARRFNMRVITVFAAIALLLTTIGVYGVASEAVLMRTREIAVRAALGASGGDLRRLIVKGGVLPIMGGVVLGTVAALIVANLLTSFLYGVEAHDVATFAAVSALVTIVGGFAYGLPAWRVARIDPVIALREE